MSGLGLPAPFRLAGFEGTFAEYVERLWWTYRAMMRETPIVLWGRPVTGGSSAGDMRDDALFWHLVTDSVDGADGAARPRRLSLGRMAHLGTLWAVLELLERDDPRVRWWRESEGGAQHTYVAPRDLSYVVVLLERPSCFVLRTAYPVDGRMCKLLRARAREGAPHATPRPVPRAKPELVRSPGAVERVRRWI